MIDSHCHIGLNQMDVTDLLMRAQLAGVTGMLSVACSLPEYPSLLKLLQDYPTIDGAFGIHPEYAASLPTDEEFTEKILAHPNIVAVGECGLDYHYMATPREVQIKAFERQIELAHRLNKPLIIHTREADADTITILESARAGGLLSAGAVIHCFTGSQELADKALELGLYISASGVITFKMSDAVRQVIRTVPLKRLLIETDSPYMAPVPYRGKINEPSYIVKTAEKLAELKGVSLREIEAVTTDNYNHLFKGQGDIHAG